MILKAAGNVVISNEAAVRVMRALADKAVKNKEERRKRNEA